MEAKETQKYRVKDKGGVLGGKEVVSEIPSFNIEQFMSTPNAGEFVKKAYYAATKKISREIAEKKNGTVPADLSSFEMIIARTLNFTKGEIKEWLDTRDWSRIANFKNPTGTRAALEAWLPTLASRVNTQHAQFSDKVAEKLIAALASKPDSIAEYLFVLLTVSRESPTIEALEL